MDTCKKPNMSKTSAFVGALKTGGVDLTKMNNVMTESCPMPNKGGSKRSKKGGRVLTFDNIKYLFVTFLTIMSGYLLTGDSIAARGIVEGLGGIFSGECAYVQNSIFGAIGFNNPICEIWSGILNQLYQAIRGNPMAIAFCWAVLRAIVAAPNDASRIL